MEWVFLTQALSLPRAWSPGPVVLLGPKPATVKCLIIPLPYIRAGGGRDGFYADSIRIFDTFPRGVLLGDGYLGTFNCLSRGSGI